MTTERPPAVGNILRLIGDTPLVKLRFVAGTEDTHATVWGKCEMMNPGGSVKDRIALAMIEEAEREGRITPGVSTIVEPTSGNTGMGLAMAAALRGYKLICTAPDKVPAEKVALDVRRKRLVRPADPKCGFRHAGVSGIVADKARVLRR